jgi:hypothetical protein
MREEDPAGELADRVAAEDVRGERRRRRHRRDVVQPEDRGPQVQRGRVPDVEQEQERDAAEEVVEGQWPAPAESIAEPARRDRPDHVHGAHHAERRRRLELAEIVLERVRHEVGEDHAIGRVPADEERRHQEPELRNVHGLLDPDPLRFLERRRLRRGERRAGGAVGAQATLGGVVTDEEQRDR